jgi:hypothetical protein
MKLTIGNNDGSHDEIAPISQKEQGIPLVPILIFRVNKVALEMPLPFSLWKANKSLPLVAMHVSWQ